MADLSTILFGTTMPSPFILASGPLSYDATGLWEAYRAGAGGVVTKTLRLERAINPTPHMVVPRSSNLRATLFNTEKWADLPWEQWVERELPAMQGHPGLLIASIGHTPAEGEVIAGPVAAIGVVDAIECVAYTKATIVDLVRRVREQAPKTPILAKLTFNWGDDLYPAAEAALEAGANGFTAIDSIGPTLQIDIETGEPTIGGVGSKAWMSGAAIRPVAQAVVAELAARFPGVPIVGTGGIIQAEDAVEMTMVGASALGVCTGPLLRGLEWFERTHKSLSAWLDAHGYARLADVRGIALPASARRRRHRAAHLRVRAAEMHQMRPLRGPLPLRRAADGRRQAENARPEANPPRRPLPLLRPVRGGVQAGRVDVWELAEVRT